MHLSNHDVLISVRHLLDALETRTILLRRVGLCTTLEEAQALVRQVLGVTQAERTDPKPHEYGLNRCPHAISPGMPCDSCEGGWARRVIAEKE